MYASRVGNLLPTVVQITGCQMVCFFHARLRFDSAIMRVDGLVHLLMDYSHDILGFIKVGESL